MFRKVFLSCLFFLLMILFVQAQLPDTSAMKYSLQQCIQLALKNNATVQHSAVASETQKITWQGVKGNMIPTLNGDISHGLNQGRSINPYTNTYSNQNTTYGSYSANSSVTLFNEFAIQNNIRQNRLAFDATKMELQQAKDATALDVILEYLQVLTNADLANLAMQQSNVSLKQVERLKILNDDGAISPSELYDLKGQYAQNQLAAVNAQNDLESSKVLLSQLMNIPYNKSIQLEKIGLTENTAAEAGNADSVYEAALKNLAIIKATELRKQSAEYSVKTYRSLRYPSLYLSGSLGTNYVNNATIQQYLNTTDVETNQYILLNGNQTPVIAKQDNFNTQKITYGNQFKNNFNSSINLGIRIPLLNNLQNRTQLKTAELQQKDAKITANYTKTQLQQNVEQSYVNLISAQKRFDVLTDQVNAFTESYREAEAKFNAGSITSVDYLVTKNNLDNANINLIIARYDYVLRSMILDYYSGRLTF